MIIDDFLRDRKKQKQKQTKTENVECHAGGLSKLKYT
jgi:hypothetical protein